MSIIKEISEIYTLTLFCFNAVVFNLRLSICGKASIMKLIINNWPS